MKPKLITYHLLLITVFLLSALCTQAQVLRPVDTAAYPHPIITVQNKHYITSLNQLGSFDTVIVKSTTPLTGTFYSDFGGTPSHQYHIINEGGPVHVQGGIDNYSVHDIVWDGWGSADDFGFIFDAPNAGFAFPLKGKSYNMTFYGCLLNGGSQEGFTAKIEVDDWVSFKFDTSVARFVQHNLYWEGCKVRLNGGESWYINSSGWFHRDQVSTRNSGKGAPFGITGTFESTDLADNITNASTTTNYIYADPLFVDQWVQIKSVITKTTGTVAGKIVLKGSNDNITYTPIDSQTLVDGASQSYAFTYATHGWNYFKVFVNTTATVAAKLNSYLDFYFNPPPSDYVTITKCISIAPGRSAVNFNNMRHAVLTFDKFWHLGRELNTAQGRALAAGGKVGYNNDTTYVTDCQVFGSFVNNFWWHGQGTLIFERNYGDSADFYGTSANTQQLAAVEFGNDDATANKFKRWIIRNNEFHGGSGGGGSIQYILYPGPNMANDNVVCNNVDNVSIDKGFPFIYSNNCANTNLPPVINAGADTAITLPLNTYTFKATANDPEGETLTYAWTQVSGPSSSFNNAAILKPTVTVTTAGNYVYQLKATDPESLFTTDQVKLTVNAVIPPNLPPVADAGPDQTITLPVNQVTVSGAFSTDPEGGAISYAWSVLSGGGLTIVSPTAVSTNITGFTQGTFVIRLIVTDDHSLKDTDDVTIHVNHALNQAPLVDAGADQTTNLPSTTVNLVGTASDPDGSIVSTLWTNTDGCSITSAGSLTTTATCTTAGEHVFTLSATDDSSATSFDYFTDTVIAAANIKPVAIASTDVTIHLPADSVVLNQSGTDADGTVVKYRSKIAASNYGATISRATTITPAIKNLFAGDTIKIAFRVQDNDSAWSDWVNTTIIVLADSVNHNPVARINRDTSTTLRQPIGQISIDANNSSDPDKGDYIASFEWKQIAGDTNIIKAGLNASVLTLDNMSVDVYRFRLIVTDTHGAKDSIDFSIQGEMRLRFKIIRSSGRTTFNPIYGALWAGYTVPQKVQASRIFGFKENRVEINFLTWNGTNSPVADQLVDSGQLVSLNIRENLYSDTTHYSNVDLTAYARHVDTLTNHLDPTKVIIVPGNEGNSSLYHSISDTTDLDPNIQMLSIVTRLGHAKGFKVADGGITSGDLVFTTYRYLSDTHDADTTNFLHYCVPPFRWTSLVNRSNAIVEFEIAKTQHLLRNYDTVPADFGQAHLYFPLVKYMDSSATNWTVDYTGINQVTKMLHGFYGNRQLSINEFGYLLFDADLVRNVVIDLRANRYTHQTYWNDATSIKVNSIANALVIITTLGNSYKNSIQ